MYQALAEVCCQKNAVMRFCSQNRQMTLSDLLDIQVAKVEANRKITPLHDPEDFFVRAESFAAERVGSELARKVIHSGNAYKSSDKQILWMVIKTSELMCKVDLIMVGSLTFTFIYTMSSVNRPDKSFTIFLATLLTSNNYECLYHHYIR